MLFGKPICGLFPALALASLLCALTPRAQAQNLVQDPGFENAAVKFYDNPSSLGDGWSVTAGTINVASNAARAHSGTHFLVFGFTTSGGAQQILATTPGQYYDLSFWLEDPSAPFLTTVSWNGVTVAGSPFTAPLGSYGNFTLNGLLATSTATTLRFSHTNISNTVWLDDVSVTASAVPEPGCVTLFVGLSMTGAGFLSRRKRRRLADLASGRQ